MARRSRSAAPAFDAISVEGSLIAPAMLAKIAAPKTDAAMASSYRIPKGLTLRDEIARFFRIAQAQYRDFDALASPSPRATRGFVELLLRDVFGFADIAPGTTREHNGRKFAATFTALGGRAPVVIGPAREDLDHAADALSVEGRRRSPALALQDWLNASDDALWGLCSNGERLRLMRNNASLTRPAYIEADLKQMFEADGFADFSTLWLLIHASRFGAAGAPVSDCELERWREAGAKEGLAARDRLRDGVEAALIALGQGFLVENSDLRARVVSGALPLDDFFGQLLRTIYRLIFLAVAEERELLHAPEASPNARRLYAQGYSLAALRALAIRRSAWDRHTDKWEGLQIVFFALAHGEKRLGLPGLGGLFLPEAARDLDAARLPNRALMEAIYNLAWLRDDSVLTPVNWRDMEAEELGSVYESLLELTPRIADDGRAFSFAQGAEAQGHARKTTGSYYTPDSLVQALLDSALDPVLDRAERMSETPAEALLALRVIDPAVGSGHFLLAAARRIASRVARIRGNGVASAQDYRHALRDAARQCLYGVDRNPMAVELTKVALWIETIEPGKPLGFLDANIRCGDALLGVFDLDVLRQGIPDEAYRPLTGDDREAARIAGRNNRVQRGQSAQHELALGGGAAEFARAAREVAAMPEDDVAGVAARARAYAAAHADNHWWATKTACDLYVAAFLMPKQFRASALVNERAPDLVPTTLDVRGALAGHPTDHRLIGKAVDLAAEAGAFHWPLEFPEVFASGGFDVVLGNPPWERIKLQEQEFFAPRDEAIATAPNAAARGRMIAALGRAEAGTRERRLFEEFEVAKRIAEAASSFARLSRDDGGRFPLTGRGDVNTYSLFTELYSRLIGRFGRAGLIVPTGIVTADTTKEFFGSLVSEQRLISFYSFFEIRQWFVATDDRNPFGLMTIGSQESEPQFAFFLDALSDLENPERRFALSPAQIAAINPNTKTAPVFRSRADAELSARIYSRIPVLIDETGANNGNPWRLSFSAMFHMANDSGLFRTAAQLQADGYDREGADWVAHGLTPRQRSLGLTGGRDSGSLDLDGGLSRRTKRYVPLYEAKMLHQFDHRWATYAADGSTSRDVSLSEKTAPDFEPTPRYWVPVHEVLFRLSPLPRWVLDALRVGDAEALSLFVARQLFIERLIEAGYPARLQECGDVFGEWKCFVKRHDGLRCVNPTRLGLVGDSPPLHRPANANCLPNVPLDQIVSTSREATAWYEVDAQALETIVASALGSRYRVTSPIPLMTASDVIAFAEYVLEASCPKWLVGWRDICRSTDERTVISAILPRAAVGHTSPLYFVDSDPARAAALYGNLNSLALDFIARLKVGGTHLTYGYLKQFAVIPPTAYTHADLAFVTPRVLELTYTSHALASFAHDLGYDGPPFVWNVDRRALVRAELDAFYARKYGLTRDELRYILDPTDVRGPDYPSETFRVLKENELRRFNEYRTARLVLSAWDRMERGELAS